LHPDCLNYGVRASWCDNEFCNTPRCPVCRHNFVVKEHVVCSNCSPETCDNCKNESDMLYPSVRTQIELDVEARKLMGRRQLNGFCIKCKANTTIGENKLCIQCIQQTLQKNRLICFYCASFERRQDIVAPNNWIGSHRGTCTNCKEFRRLDQDGLCVNCYSTYILHRIRCYTCQSYFTPTKDDQTHCATCQEVCLGCNTKFSPANAIECFCSACLHLVSRGICVMCKKPQRYPLSTRGHCSTCDEPYLSSASTEERFWCRACNIEEVNSPEQLCSNCKTKDKLCPGCYNQTIHVADWICKVCRDVRTRKHTEIRNRGVGEQR